MEQGKIGVIVRMDWEDTQNLLPAMGRSLKDSRVVQDVEAPNFLGAGFLQEVVTMVDVHGALELFVIGSTASQTAKDVLERVNSLRDSNQLPASISIHGLLYDPKSYRLEVVHNGYKESEHGVL